MPSARPSVLVLGYIHVSLNKRRYRERRGGDGRRAEEWGRIERSGEERRGGERRGDEIPGKSFVRPSHGVPPPLQPFLLSPSLSV